jgi:hypothetical protein
MPKWTDPPGRAVVAPKAKSSPEYRYQEYLGRSGAAPSPPLPGGPRKFTSLQNLFFPAE